MNVNSITNALPGLIKSETEKPLKSGFEDIFSNLIQNVNQAQMDSSKITQDFVTGKDVELHDVMIAGEKAKTSLDLLMEIRNKTIDMYKELTRMQA
ncbi:MAG: flagellar hook-basal body complex protein FliE [Ignavibacteriaceae bacterium]